MTNPTISQYSHGQLHSFLDELKNGTRNYQTVSSLVQQVAQEYRGRSVIELLQNAHDALAGAPVGDPQQITFVLRTDPTPTLLIANSGVGFRPEDFRGICQLGQSPKDPNKSVGNKGLGFRSVLELSTCPEIWSSSPGGDAPAFRFGFSPQVLETVSQSLAELRQQGLAARSPFIPTIGLVDWAHERLEQFQAAASQLDGEMVAQLFLTTSWSFLREFSPF